jgi:formylglycine-generating enzyme required for sulfatase activity
LADVFISYSREDRDVARHVANSLEAEGFSVWWDAVLRAGETYDEETERNLRNAGAVVVLWSKHSANSKWVRAEATVGERSSTLVPALLEECERPIRFELVQTADLTQWRGERTDPNWRAFMTDIRAAIGRQKNGAPPIAAAAPIAATPPSVETTFWNSIKDGTNKSDFDAYLARYPNGHFVDLARNRITALSRASSQGQATQSPPPRKPAANPAPAARQRAASPPPQPVKKSGSVDGFIYGGIALGLLVLGVVAFTLLRQPGDAEKVAAVSETSAPQPPVVETPAAALGEPGLEENAASEAGTADLESDPIDDVFADVDDGAFVESGGDLPADAGIPVEDISTLLAAESVDAAPEEEIVSAVPAAGDVTTFRDCDTCPLMARLPGGVFLMGSPSDEPGRNAYEGPQHEVSVKPFAISAYEVTLEEWAPCVEDGVCIAKPASTEANMPVLSVSWRDANAYARWLTRKTGRKYRLPTEAEWEYAARGGTTTVYWWGDRYDRTMLATGNAHAVGAYAANAFGLYDMLGNAREWVEDCYVNNYLKAPVDGAAMTDGDCSRRVIRGGAWSSPASDTRIANRSRIDQVVRAQYMGVRLVADPD